MEIIAIKMRLDALEAAVAQLTKQPAPTPSVKVVVEAPVVAKPEAKVDAQKSE